MTRPLYYEDPYRSRFSATISRIEPADGPKAHPAVALSETAFYPEGGGQPADRGSLNGLPVVDTRKQDGEILHYLAPGSDTSGLAPGDSVEAELDWSRRFDYMQQHTGQHVISAALMHVGAYPTVSVHQGEEYTTIEIDADALPERDRLDVEERANEIVAANAPVLDYQVTEDRVPELELRRPPKVSGTIRIVEIQGYDRVACGGVHLSRTGEVGWIKLIGTERIRGRVRTVWKIGRRALEDYRLKDQVSARLTELLSVQPAEIPERSEKLTEKLSQREWEIEQLNRRVAGLLADAMCRDEGPVTGRLGEEDADKLRSVVEHVVTTHHRPAAVVAADGERLRWCIGVPEDRAFAFNELRERLLPPIGGKGGGKPPYWQGVGEKPEGAETLFAEFRKLL